MNNTTYSFESPLVGQRMWGVRESGRPIHTSPVAIVDGPLPTGEYVITTQSGSHYTVIVKPLTEQQTQFQ